MYATSELGAWELSVALSFLGVVLVGVACMIWLFCKEEGLSFQDPQEQLEFVSQQAYNAAEFPHKLEALRDVEGFIKDMLHQSSNQRFVDDRQAQSILQYVQGQIVKLHG